MSLNSLVISGIRDEEYFIILDNTDHEYFPYLSLRFIKFFKSYFSKLALYIFLKKDKPEKAQ